MKTILIIVVIVVIVAIFQLLKYRLETLKCHELFYRIGKGKSILVYDKEDLLATVYENNVIEYTYIRPLSYFKLAKIQYIADNFESSYNNLIEEHVRL